jgi:hypothetical protein
VVVSFRRVDTGVEADLGKLPALLSADRLRKLRRIVVRVGVAESFLCVSPASGNRLILAVERGMA